MSNLGVKIVGEELEVGFTVSSREAFDEAILRLMTLTATMWKAADAEPETAPAADPRATMTPTSAIGWREAKGLR